MTEILAAETWLYGALAASSSVYSLVGGQSSPRIYADVAPQGATMPYIVFQNIPPGEDWNTQGVRHGAVLTYMVKACAEGEDKASADAILAAVDGVIHNAATSGNGYSINCVRESVFTLPQLVDGASFRQVVGKYQIILRT